MKTIPAPATEERSGPVVPSAPPAQPPGRQQSSPELAAELKRIQTEAKIEADRQRQEELARQRELARFD